MNKITRKSELMVPKVTTGPINASKKVYDSPDGYPDLRVPFREIALTDPEQPTFRVYDSSGPYTDEMKPFVEQMMNKRVAVRIRPERVRSWDHRKLGLPAMPLGGTTAEYLK